MYLFYFSHYLQAALFQKLWRIGPVPPWSCSLANVNMTLYHETRHLFISQQVSLVFLLSLSLCTHRSAWFPSGTTYPTLSQQGRCHGGGGAGGLALPSLGLSRPPHSDYPAPLTRTIPPHPAPLTRTIPPPSLGLSRPIPPPSLGLSRPPHSDYPAPSRPPHSDYPAIPPSLTRTIPLSRPPSLGLSRYPAPSLGTIPPPSLGLSRPPHSDYPAPLTIQHYWLS